METPQRISLINEMLKKDPTDAFLNYAVALELAKQGEINEAIDTLKQLIKRKPDYLPSYYQLGKYYEETNKTEKAIDIYRKGVELAQKQNNNKAQGELSEALWLLED